MKSDGNATSAAAKVLVALVGMIPVWGRIVDFGAMDLAEEWGLIVVILVIYSCSAKSTQLENYDQTF